MFRTGGNPGCNIPHIYEIIPSLYCYRQLSTEKGQQHIGDAAFPTVARTDDAGGKYHAGIQPPLRSIKNQGSCDGLTLCVIAPHQFRRKHGILCDLRSLGFFWNGVD